MAAVRGGHKAGLLHRANAIGLTSTTHLAGTGVVAVATAVGGRHIREGSAVTIFVTCSHHRRSRAELLGVCQNAGHGAGGNINDVVDRAPALREASQVSRQKAETLLASDWSRRNAGIQPQQISNRSGVFRTAARANRSHVLDQRQEISARRRGNWNPSDKQMSQ